MFRAKRGSALEELIPIPAKLPPVEGLEEQEKSEARQRPRVWFWTLITALAVLLLLAYVVLLAVLGFRDGLKDRALHNRDVAQEHYAAGLSYVEAGNYELAIAEFEQALRHDSSLYDARFELRRAKDLARVVATPTSETRRDAATLLYRQAVAHYEGGKLAQAVAVLDELRGLDPGYEQENVATMLATAHYQLGLDAVQEDLLDEARAHFETVMALRPGDKAAQEQLNLIYLYTAALNYWEQDWTLTVQTLKGLYALAPDYKDVQARLHNAYVHSALEHARQGDWCRAAQEYAAAAEVLPLEETVDRRDDAAIRCQATAEAPTPTATIQATARPSGGTAQPTAAPTASAAAQATPTADASTSALGGGKIAFTSYDAVRQRYDVYAINLDQGDARLLRENARQPALAPGGNELAFRNLDPVHLGLGVLDLHSNEFTELTASAEDSTPAWSPNKEQIVFASNKHGDRRWRVYAISPRAVRGEGDLWSYGQMPTWSPDGSQVAYHGCDERGNNCGVWAMKAGGFDPAPLTTDASDTAPAWSPDGKQVAFVSARAGNWEIYTVDVATGQELRLTEHPAADVAPAWSPDGKRLAFLSNREGVWAVYVLTLKSAQAQKIIATGDAYPDPVSERLSWTP